MLRHIRPWIVLGVSVCLATSLGCSQSAGHWVRLFDGKDLAGWKTLHEQQHGNAWMTASDVKLDPANPKLFVITPGDGILVNGVKGKTCNIYTMAEFGDCALHIEFMVPKESNSGVYLMGEYEVQILDSYGVTAPTFSDCGGIYARWIDNQNVDGVPPMVNASRAPGEWQTYDITFRAPRFDADGNKIENAQFIKVIQNGKVIHENVDLKGPTRAGMSETESPRGPLMLQGDHGPVAYRNIKIKPLGDGDDENGDDDHEHKPRRGRY